MASGQPLQATSIPQPEAEDLSSDVLKQSQAASAAAVQASQELQQQAEVEAAKLAMRSYDPEVEDLSSDVLQQSEEATEVAVQASHELQKEAEQNGAVLKEVLSKEGKSSATT